MFSVTHESVTMHMGRDRKIRTALRTNQIARFVTVPSEEKNDISLESRFLDNKRGSVGTKDHFLRSMVIETQT